METKFPLPIRMERFTDKTYFPETFALDGRARVGKLAIKRKRIILQSVVRSP